MKQTYFSLFFLVILSLTSRIDAQDPAAVGADFQVNTYTTGGQGRPQVALDGSGNFVVVWHGDGSGSDTSNSSIQARRFSSSGSALGDDFQVNSYTTNSQDFPSAASDSAGNFIVAWISSGSAGSDNSDESIQAQRFSSSGNALGDEFQVNSYTTGLQVDPVVAVDAAGNFVVVWTSLYSPGNDTVYSIQAQRFNSSGSPLGEQFQVNSYTTSLQSQPSAAFDAAGRFVVAWMSFESGGDDSNVRSIQARRFSSSGSAIGDDFQVNSYTTDNQQLPSAAMDAAGDFVVAWQSDDSGGSDSNRSVQARRFSSSGNALGDDFQVNSYTTDNQEEPSAAMDAEGNFVVVWISGGSSGTDSDRQSIQGRRYDSNGSPAGGEFQINTYTTLAQARPSAAVDDLGDFVVAWNSSGSSGSDSDGYSVQARRYRVTKDVGDRVWLDENGNGVQDGGEQGAEGVTVTLFDSGGVQVGQAVTDGDGLYRIPAVVGDYYLHFALPTDNAFTLRDVGDDTSDSDASVDGWTVVFNVSDSDSTRDAGLVSTLGSLGDRVWLDADLDGVQDGGEVGVEGVSVELFTFASVSVGTTTTAADGSYSFTDLPPGSYYLAFSEPAGLCYTVQDQGGDDARDSDVDPLTFTTGEIVLGASQDDRSWDAGLVPDATVGNRVWLDDGDGIQSGFETGVEDVTVRLYDEFGAQLDETMTDDDGRYSFAPGPGEYFLEFVLPVDMAFAPRDQGSDDAADSDAFAASGATIVFSLGPGAVDATRDAGLEPATIGNRVWSDADGDGRQQPDESGIGGVVVRLLDEFGAQAAQTVTDADGVYGFLGVPSGDYSIEVIAPPGFAFSPQNAGGDDLIDSDVDPSTGRTALFSYGAATASRSHDAGLLGVFFFDGFESGDVSGWTNVVP